MNVKSEPMIRNYGDGSVSIGMEGLWLQLDADQTGWLRAHLNALVMPGPSIHHPEATWRKDAATSAEPSETTV